jgi:RES domain-containing protein
VTGTALTWETSFRIIAARVPRIAIFEDVARPEDLDNALAIEAIANDRLREAVQAIRLVPTHDRVVGPGASFVMAPFAYIRPGRFSPGGVRGVYYAGESLDTAIAETSYHRARFLADTNEKPLIAEHRLIEARIAGTVVDVGAAPKKTQTAVLDPDAYGASFDFGAKVDAAGHDGVLYRSVRRRAGTCAGIYRPRCVHDARTTMYLGYRWNGRTIGDVFSMKSLTKHYPPEPGARELV